MHKGDGIMSLISSRRETPSLLLYARPLGRFGRALRTARAIACARRVRAFALLSGRFVPALCFLVVPSVCLSPSLLSGCSSLSPPRARSVACPPRRVASLSGSWCSLLGLRSLLACSRCALLSGLAPLRGVKSLPPSAGALLIAVAIAVAVTLMPPTR